MEETSELKKLLAKVDEIYADDDAPYLLLLAVEVTKEGFPRHRAMRVNGTPATGMASVIIAQGMLDTTMKEIQTRMEENTHDDSEEDNLKQRLREFMKEKGIDPEQLASLAMLRNVLKNRGNDVN